MVKYTIEIKDPAARWLKKYDIEIQKRFAAKIRKLKENPDLYGKPLRGKLHGYWELYFEKRFRILYTIDYKVLCRIRPSIISAPILSNGL